MFDGDMSRDVMEERREVHCLRAILSEQDFESVGGASGREGLRRTFPSSEKKPLPYKIGRSGDVIRSESAVEIEESGEDRVVDASSAVPSDAGDIAHGVESSWAAIVSSILASPPRGYLARTTLRAGGTERTGRFRTIHVEIYAVIQCKRVEMRPGSFIFTP